MEPDFSVRKKTNELVQQHIGADFVTEPLAEYLVIDENTIEIITANEVQFGTGTPLRGEDRGTGL